jgi:hypothetical protein
MDQRSLRALCLILRTVGQLSAIVGAYALDVRERERTAARVRLDDAFAAQAAERRWRETNDNKEAALTALCGYRCGSPDELAVKFRYLADNRYVLAEEQHDAIFASLLSKAEALAGLRSAPELDAVRVAAARVRGPISTPASGVSSSIADVESPSPISAQPDGDSLKCEPNAAGQGEFRRRRGTAPRAGFRRSTVVTYVV